MAETLSMTRSSSGDDVCYFTTPRQIWAEDRERAEHVFDIPLGSIVVAVETGRRWIFLGWDRNSAGSYPRFVEERTPDRFHAVPLVDYHAVFVDTLVRKFPDLERFRKAPSTAT